MQGRCRLSLAARAAGAAREEQGHCFPAFSPRPVSVSFQPVPIATARPAPAPVLSRLGLAQGCLLWLGRQPGGLGGLHEGSSCRRQLGRGDSEGSS